MMLLAHDALRLLTATLFIGIGLASERSLNDLIFESKLQEVMWANDAWAGSLTIVNNGKLYFSCGSGTLLKDSKVKVNPSVAFRWASCTKPLTGELIARLIADGVYKSDYRPFKKWRELSVIPKETPAEYDNVTIDNLLSHSAGWDRAKSGDPVFGFPGIERFKVDPSRVEPWDMIKEHSKKKLDYSPGSSSAYSNFGYVVLARVVEEGMKKRFNECVRDYCRSTFEDDGFDVAGYPSERRLVQPSYNCESSYPALMADGACGMVASTDSLCRYLDRSYKTTKNYRHSPGDWKYFGSTPGTLSVLKKRPDGISYACAINSRIGTLDSFLIEMDDLIDRSILGPVNTNENNRVIGLWDFKDDTRTYVINFDGETAKNSDGNGGRYKVDGSGLSIKWRGQNMYVFKGSPNKGFDGVSPGGSQITLRKK